jgi:MoaA/NifB/PqqE/SkfB family radical SAM enzyme
VYAYGEIRHVHLEPTTQCNARCPMCARNTRGVTDPGLPLTQLSLADVRAILDEPFVAQLKALDMCGAYGDPGTARELHEIVSYLTSAGPELAITVWTNGGMRTPRFWARLATLLGPHGRVVFAIDGLGETNGVYRRGVNFDKVIENARAFIAAGGDARWDFLVFRHNEHQVGDARALSEELGFREFSLKKTDRFLEPLYDYVAEFDGREDLDAFPIFERDGRIVDFLEAPQDPALVNRTSLHRSELLDHYASLDDLFDSTPIHCRILDTASVFVSAQGYAFPCCWTYVQATRPEYAGHPDRSNRQLVELVERAGGFGAVSARRIGLRAVVEGQLFADVEASWSCGSVGEGRLKVCARACGADFPAYFDQFADSELVPRSLRT